jgi:hypothetical protein
MDALKNKVLVIGRYTNNGNLEIAGGSAALIQLAELLILDVHIQDIWIHIPQDKPSTPYDGFLKQIKILSTDSYIVIRREENVLYISGSKNNLALLSEDIKMLAHQIDQYSTIPNHSHIEYHPDHSYLDPSSLPMVISVR